MQTNVTKTENMNIKTFYVFSVCMSGEIILEYHKVGWYGPDRTQGQFFVCFSRKNPIKVVSVKVTSIVVDIQFIDDIASADGIKTRLVA